MTWIFISRNKDLPPFRLDERLMDDLVTIGAFLALGIGNAPQLIDIASPSNLLVTAGPNTIRNRKDSENIVKSNPAKAAGFAILGYTDLLEEGMKSFQLLKRPLRRKIEKEAKKSGTDIDTIFENAKKDIKLLKRFSYWLSRSSGCQFHRLTKDELKNLLEPNPATVR